MRRDRYGKVKCLFVYSVTNIGISIHTERHRDTYRDKDPSYSLNRLLGQGLLASSTQTHTPSHAAHKITPATDPSTRVTHGSTLVHLRPNHRLSITRNQWCVYRWIAQHHKSTLTVLTDKHLHTHYVLSARTLPEMSPITCFLGRPHSIIIYTECVNVFVILLQ